MLFQICTWRMTARTIRHAQKITAMKICITSSMMTPRSLCNVTNMAAVLYILVPRALSSVRPCRCASTSDSSENVAHCANHGNYYIRNIEDLDRHEINWHRSYCSYTRERDPFPAFCAKCTMYSMSLAVAMFYCKLMCWFLANKFVFWKIGEWPDILNVWIHTSQETRKNAPTA